ncbi:MAG TPA: hypothetical protein VHE30_14455 [Polyangiaceae bacterium]|nr:hypothetical protein [Polyangiaceae bacterium]
MSTHRSRILVLGLALGLTTTGEVAQAAAARSPYAPRGEAMLLGVLGFPFHSTDAAASAGFGLGAGFGFGQIPLTLGVDFIAAYGGTKKTTLDVPAGPDSFALEQARETRTFLLDSWIRLQPESWVVRPYLEGTLGGAQFETKDTLTFVKGTGTTTAFRNADWVGTFGWGVGADFWGLANRDGSVSITVGVRRSSGGAVVYDRSVSVAGSAQPLRAEANASVTLVMIGFGGRMDFVDAPEQNKGE